MGGWGLDLLISGLATVVVVLSGTNIVPVLALLFVLGLCVIAFAYFARRWLTRRGHDPAGLILHVVVTTGITVFALGIAALECITCR